MIKKIIILTTVVLVIFLTIFGIYTFLNRKTSAVEEEIKIPVLLYHDVVTDIPESDPYNFEYITTIDSFEENIKTLLEEGYSIITITELYNLDKENKNLPSKPIIINFDDGLISNYELVFPVLQKYNIKVGMSITTDLVGTTDVEEDRCYFSWEQAKEMQDSGLVEFYSHGKRHVFYRNIPITEFKEEIIESINTINSKLQTNCYVFTYPYGSYNTYMVNTLEKANIKIQLYDTGTNKFNNINYSYIRRINISHGITGDDIISYIESI